MPGARFRFPVPGSSCHFISLAAADSLKQIQIYSALEGASLFSNIVFSACGAVCGKIFGASGWLFENMFLGDCGGLFQYLKFSRSNALPFKIKATRTEPLRTLPRAQPSPARKDGKGHWKAAQTKLLWNSGMGWRRSGQDPEGQGGGGKEKCKNRQSSSPCKSRWHCLSHIQWASRRLANQPPGRA